MYVVLFVEDCISKCKTFKKKKEAANFIQRFSLQNQNNEDTWVDLYAKVEDIIFLGSTIEVEND